MVTDTIRALIMEYFGYKTQVMEFIEMEHTPKNVLLVGKKTGRQANRDEVLKEIKNLKERYGIRQHYLESVLKLAE